MYYERLPAYEYDLPCGHTFRSVTRSVTYVPGKPARHYFHCTRCGVDHSITPADLIERPPMLGTRKLGDGQLAIRVDSAIKADRVRAYYLRHWDEIPFWDVCQILGVSHKIVRRVAADLGVYGDGEPSSEVVRHLSSTEGVTAAEKGSQAA